MGLVKDQYNISEPWHASKSKPEEKHPENSRAEKRRIPAAEMYSPSRHTNTDSDSSEDNDASKHEESENENGTKENKESDEAASNSDSEVGSKIITKEKNIIENPRFCK